MPTLVGWQPWEARGTISEPEGPEPHLKPSFHCTLCRGMDEAEGKNVLEEANMDVLSFVPSMPSLCQRLYMSLHTVVLRKLVE